LYWAEVTDQDAPTAIEPERYLLAEFDFTKGTRQAGADEWMPWDEATAGTDAESPDGGFHFIKDPPMDETYESINGFSHDYDSISFDGAGYGWKTAVVVNRVVYAGGIRMKNKNGIVETMGDAMIKSIVGKFDTFVPDRIIEASVRDGDEIVKLEEYADRILQFKKKKMHLINVSQNLEFLEDTFMHKGIANPASAVKTDYGVAWVNENGAYLYDGQKVTDLLEKRGRQIIKESTWASFLGAAPVIGYLPNKRQLIILKTAGSEGTGNIYLFDMVTQSWTTGDSKFTDSARQTNFVVDANNNLVIGQQATPFQVADIAYWDDNADVSGTGTYKLHTKDIDFGQPGQRKKVYKTYISYKGDGDSVTVQYAVNGDTDTVAPFYRTTADGSSDKTNSDTTPLLDSNTDDWILAELKPVTSIKSVYSFQLRLGGTAESDFEINDISIVYRLKNIK